MHNVFLTYKTFSDQRFHIRNISFDLCNPLSLDIAQVERNAAKVAPVRKYSYINKRHYQQQQQRNQQQQQEKRPENRQSSKQTRAFLFSYADFFFLIFFFLTFYGM